MLKDANVLVPDFKFSWILDMIVRGIESSQFIFFLNVLLDLFFSSMSD